MQDRLNDLAILSIESDLTRKVDFSDVINAFALKKGSESKYILVCKTF